LDTFIYRIEGVRSSHLLAYALACGSRAVSDDDRGTYMSWHPGDIYRAWDEINHSLVAVMKQLPRETLQFLAFRAADPIIRQKASEVLDWLDNRSALPDWGWFVPAGVESLRCTA
jgi:hypothetical protein